LRFDTMPSRPILQAWANTVGPSPSICSLNRMPEPALTTMDASVALRTSSGSRRRSSPFNSMRSKAYRNRAVIMAAVANEIERGNAVVITGDSFPVNDAGARTQAGQRFDNPREATSEIIAWTAVEPHLRAVLAGNYPKTVVLNLVQTLAAGRQLIG